MVRQEVLGDPDLHEIAFGDRGMMRGIDACVDSQCLVSAVSLVYSAIDAIAALDRPILVKEGYQPRGFQHLL